MSFIYAEKYRDENVGVESVRILCDTKIIPDENTSMHFSEVQCDCVTKYGIVKSTICNPQLCVSYAGNNILFAARLFSKLRDMESSLSFSEADMDAISERLSTIEDAKRKYNKNVDEIIAYRDELSSKLEMILNFDSEKARLADNAHKKYAVLEEQAKHVSEIRHIIAEKLQSAMERELNDLEFANSEFKIDIQKLDEIGPLGFDKVEFLISTNPGEPLMPLAKIASGGEISRIMLAFKHIIGESDSVETMIFDEIDTGISGRTALVVGKKLSEIAEHRQILSVTHLPQIAAYGDDNFLITKSIDELKPYTEINHLDADGKVRMIATLFSGSDSDASALDAAKKLIDNAK